MCAVRHWLLPTSQHLPFLPLSNRHWEWQRHSNKLLLQLHQLHLLSQLYQRLLPIKWQLFSLLSRMFPMHQRVRLYSLCSRILPQCSVLLELLQCQQLPLLLKSHFLHLLSFRLLSVGPRLSVLPNVVPHLHISSPVLVLSPPILSQLQSAVHPLPQSLPNLPFDSLLSQL